MKCVKLLDEAALLIGGDRNTQHGTKKDNFENIAKLWSGYLHRPISPADVALMMVLLKVARTKTGSFNRDDYLDLCGYGAIAYELESD